MARARVCDVCGRVISNERDMIPVNGYTITLQKPKFFSTEVITIDLCSDCFEQVKEISKMKHEEQENE